MTKIASLVTALLLVPFHLWAQEVFTRDGNVFLRTAQSGVIQMTTSGLDSDPSLSADGKSIVFVRDTPGELVDAAAGRINATELWLMNISTRKADLLIKGKDDPDRKRTLAGFHHPIFSPDNHSVYFISEAWVVSGAIHKILLNTKEVDFLIDGASFGVISVGRYSGYVLVHRNLVKFDKNGDSLGRDSYLFLVSPDGKPVKEIGQSDSKAAREFWKRNIEH